jgi:hypothetical protein
MISAEDNVTGTVLSCTNADCGCRLRIQDPCPHGVDYTCACGHPFDAVGAGPMADNPA